MSMPFSLEFSAKETATILKALLAADRLDEDDYGEYLKLYNEIVRCLVEE